MYLNYMIGQDTLSERDVIFLSSGKGVITIKQLGKWLLIRCQVSGFKKIRKHIYEERERDTERHAKRESEIITDI